MLTIVNCDPGEADVIHDAQEDYGVAAAELTYKPAYLYCAE